jgi:hypothetical protein
VYARREGDVFKQSRCVPCVQFSGTKSFSNKS